MLDVRYSEVFATCLKRGPHLRIQQLEYVVWCLHGFIGFAQKMRDEAEDAINIFMGMSYPQMLLCDDRKQAY